MKGPPILVVDDRAANLKLCRALLEREGYEVQTATSAETALELLKACTPGLILMDIRLPGMDGLALTRQLRTELSTQDIPIVALSADALAGDEERARAAGCDGYVSKPIDLEFLLKVVARHLATGRVLP